MLSQKEIIKSRNIFKETDKGMVSVFKILSDFNRYRIFRLLAAQPKLTVSNIAQILNISLPLASQHLKLLVAANLLQKERVGKKVFPKIEKNNLFVQSILMIIKKL